MFKKISIKIPTEEELERMHRKKFEDNKNNPNALSFWYPKVEPHFLTPKTRIIPVPWEIWDSLEKMDGENDGIPDKDLTAWIIEELEKTDLDLSQDLFVKTGSFSNKFTFSDCHIKAGELPSIGHKLKSMVYACLCVGCEFIPEFAVREFIHTSSNRPNIYGGMKLNTEFRVFYDFDERKLVRTVNYWDYSTMMGSLYDAGDKETFAGVGHEIERDFQENKPALEAKVAEAAKKVGLAGKWSMDFMLADGNFYLIDMALAEQSYYWENGK